MAADRNAFADEYEALATRIGLWMELDLEPFDPDAGDPFYTLSLEVCEFQRKWNPAYGKFCEGVRVDHWKSIPAVPTSAFRDLDRPMTCFPVEDAIAYFETSGTTGEVRGRHYFHRFGLYRKSIELGWLVAETPLGMRCHWLPGLGGRSSLGYMLGHLSGRGPAEKLEFDEPVVLMGTALAFLHLFESGCERLPEGSWAMETGGYKGTGRETSKAELYGMFEKHLGVPPEQVVNEYGMTELCSQFYARGVGGYHCGPHWVQTVVRSPETGEEVAVGEAGYLTIYDLANLGSAMAVATRDIAVRRDEDMFELVGRDPAAIPRGCSRAADEFFSDGRWR